MKGRFPCFPDLWVSETISVEQQRRKVGWARYSPQIRIAWTTNAVDDRSHICVFSLQQKTSPNGTGAAIVDSYSAPVSIVAEFGDILSATEIYSQCYREYADASFQNPELASPNINPSSTHLWPLRLLARSHSEQDPLGDADCCPPEIYG